MGAFVPDLPSLAGNSPVRTFGKVAEPVALAKGDFLQRNLKKISQIHKRKALLQEAGQRQEKAGKPIAAGPVEKRPDYGTVLWMSALLSFLSGMVNALAILDMAMTVSHHTGNASHTGRLLSVGMDSAMRFFALIGAFAGGASIIGYSKSDGEAIYHGRYSPGLLAAAIAVAGGVYAHTNGRTMITLALWAMSQGMQNAITRRCSSMPVCTTHMTGYLTDFGSNLGAIARDGKGGPPPRKPKLFALGIFAFIAGGYVAKQVLPSLGPHAALLPAAAMAIVSLGLPNLRGPPETIKAVDRAATPQVATAEKVPLEGATNLASPALQEAVKKMPSSPIHGPEEVVVADALEAAAKAAQQLEAIVGGMDELKIPSQSQKV